MRFKNFVRNIRPANFKDKLSKFKDVFKNTGYSIFKFALKVTPLVLLAVGVSNCGGTEVPQQIDEPPKPSYECLIDTTSIKPVIFSSDASIIPPESDSVTVLVPAGAGDGKYKESTITATFTAEDLVCSIGESTCSVSGIMGATLSTGNPMEFISWPKNVTITAEIIGEPTCELKEKN